MKKKGQKHFMCTLSSRQIEMTKMTETIIKAAIIILYL